ncbi:hypothetical protein [Pseudodesulfovibrio tunisiensis]|uniref:hypothetical protein n=1 Tax=Pseudodesulfovibrio tunisiensis TaxID=463192 RepID=UPI001FB3B927|nr:hypothetical protein [Pseudodesulfovibrio tunisiensis]
MSFEVEKTEQEKEQEQASPIRTQRELSAEEERRVVYLKNLLSQLLAMSAGDPSDQQKERIREAEKELEKITGVKIHSSLSDMTARMPGRNRKKTEKEEERNALFAKGIDPKEAAHIKQPERNPGPGLMSFLQQQASGSYQKMQTLSEFPGNMFSGKFV